MTPVPRWLGHCEVRGSCFISMYVISAQKSSKVRSRWQLAVSCQFKRLFCSQLIARYRDFVHPAAFCNLISHQRCLMISDLAKKETRDRILRQEATVSFNFQVFDHLSFRLPTTLPQRYSSTKTNTPLQSKQKNRFIFFLCHSHFNLKGLVGYNIFLITA